MKLQSSNSRSRCPISLSLDVLGDKWTLLVLRDLIFWHKRHFRDFLSSDEKIATNILANRLRLL
jgi:DNA-binding HxlR family transcriptional regulator